MEGLPGLLFGSCERTAELLNAEADGELGRFRRARLRLHLRMCDGCRSAAYSLRAAVSALNALALLQPEAAPCFPESVIERIRAERDRR
jgi:predicted anti-sigma-YlaC factor YlaD